MYKVLILSFTTLLFLTSCSSKTYSISIHPKQNNETRKLLLFLDGTHNEQKSRTNVAKLFNIVDNQSLDNHYLFHNEGVGTGAKIMGMGTGLGFGKDVREAYEFLTLNYKVGSKIYLFGFSRGAYTARVLSTMLQTVGLYDVKYLSDKERKEFIHDLYTKVYKGRNKKKDDIVKAAKEYVASWRHRECEQPFNFLKRPCGVTINQIELNNSTEIPVEIMGIWDTVEALGINPTKEAALDKLDVTKDIQKIVNPNNLYFENYCNVKKTFHALSLDDNRAYVFTPIIMTGEKNYQGCLDYNISKQVDEVWFAGAHTDVGGGGYPYTFDNLKEDLGLPGVSLNWMIQKLHNLEPELFPNIKLYENPMGLSHNSEKNLPTLYREAERIDILRKYSDESDYSTIKLHDSVKTRLENISKINNRDDYNSKWYLDKFFNKCFSVCDENSSRVDCKVSDSKDCNKTIEWVTNNKN